MKKSSILILLLSFISHIIIAMEVNQTPWREQFKNINHTELQIKLGYNAKLQLIKDRNTDTEHNNCVTVYFHGWTAAGNAHFVLKQIDKIPGDKIIFNFEDASSWLQVPRCITKWTGIKSIPYWFPHINRSSLAQEEDIKTAITILATLKNAGINQFVIYGQSRGAGVATAMLGYLNQQNEVQYKEILKGIKFVHLDSPLKDVKTALKVHPLAKLLGLIGIKFSYLEQKLVPWLSRYQPNRKSPIQWIEKWPKDFPAGYYPQHNDNKVGNEDDHIFAEKLLEKNKNTTICPLNDGDHKNGINSIQKIIHTIHQKYGAPYSDTLITTNNNISTIKMYDKQDDIQSFITTCYTNYKKENENQSYISILKRNLINYVDGMSG